MKLFCAAILAAMLLVSTARAQGCSDPQTVRVIGCLKSVVIYTQSMIRDDQTHSPLRNGIDAIYSNVQRAWTGPWRERRYAKALLFWPGVAIVVLILTLWLARAFAPPRYPIGGTPRWTTERNLLFAIPLVLLACFGVERWITYRHMNEDYARVSAVVKKFVHLSSPRFLAAAPADPCHYAYSQSEYEPFTVLCSQPRLWEAHQRIGDIVETPLIRLEVLDQLRAIGGRCQSIDFVPEWTNANNERARADVEQCVVMEAASTPIVVGDFFPVAASFAEWLHPAATDESAQFRLENALRVPNIEGKLPFVQKIDDLTSDKMYDDFRQRFRRYTYWTLALLAVSLFIMVLLYFLARRHELIYGNRKAARALSLGTYIILIVGVLLTLAPFGTFIPG